MAIRTVRGQMLTGIGQGGAPTPNHMRFGLHCAKQGAHDDCDLIELYGVGVFALIRNWGQQG